MVNKTWLKQVSRYLYHATFCIMILVSLHTKSSIMFHAVCLQIVPAKMENPDNEDIIIQIEETVYLFLWPNNITTFFPFPVMFYLQYLLYRVTEGLYVNIEVKVWILV
jgi:hypothetical protein